MKPAFVAPELTVLPHIGPLTNAEIAALPDDALETYLRENGYFEAKKARMDEKKAAHSNHQHSETD